ncbi:binding-protein-dependent transport systems inner membrane component [Caballeronia arvi]|uniref:Binding-protein-dependent transport systems inner membrane component n=1 Tax=Caballeronia arvi TaxID=1777135 RepID=A0A158KSB8_9BURK|nr:ABC transporter permease [Caballeronia arvi]SAL83490.1 binding-protein-dependent transport systems inner membrane component [Caballeronia arvi]
MQILQRTLRRQIFFSLGNLNEYTMAKLILSRLLLGAGTLLAVSVLIFVCTQILPGDVASAVLGQDATPEALVIFRKELGLDLPAYMRYFNWFTGALHGDLGVALTNKRVILDEIAPRLANTMFLAGYAALIAIPLAVGLGILSAINEGKLIDKLSNIITLTAISLPEFFAAYLLIIFLAVDVHWLPSLSTVYKDMPFTERVYQTTLPALTLTVVVAAHMLRMTRSSVLSVMSTAYIEMAFLKGARRGRVIVRHALPNAAAPIITVVALNMAYLVVGVVVIEAVFVYPGMGQLMVDAVAKRDVPVVQACGLMFAAVFVVLNTLADILVILVNPRLRHKR